jgi:argininosuccinate lyase
MSSPTPSAMDINEVFRGGARSVEFLDQINKASIVMLNAAAIIPRPVAARIAGGIAEVIAQERESSTKATRSRTFL